ncbi:MAG: hypothetical protein MI919_10450 [Holophagales bacterium]|nr:hypothetical protein [Holophagales bacterium]
MRLFLAVPHELEKEREIAESVVARLNREAGEGEDLEVVDWHRRVGPLANLPETVAFRNLDVAEDDVFVGMSWLAFDPGEESDERQGACTERDLELGYNYWKTLRRPRALFLRCLRLPESLKRIDGHELDRVVRFFHRFDDPQKNRFAYREFQDGAELESVLGTELEGLCRGQAPAVTPAAANGRTRGELRGSTRFEKKMEPGKAYEVTFLSLEIARWQELDHSHTKEHLETLSRAFLELVRATAKNYGGEVFSWRTQGGELMFWSKRSYDHAIMTGLKVMHNLPVFNLDPAQNPLGTTISLRVAAHDAVIVFQLPIEEISSADLSYVVALQRENTEAGELTITRRLLQRIDDRLTPHFQFKGRYEREPIYSCKLPSGRREAQQANLEELCSKLERQASLAMGLLQGPASGLDVSALDSLSTAVDETYSVLNRFSTGFSSVDRNWAPEVLARVADASSRLRGREEQLWSRLRQRLAERSLASGTQRRLEALVRAASRRRSRSVVILEKLEERCRSLAEGSEAPQVPRQELEGELLKPIDALIRADELDNETALTEILLHHKRAFLAYLVERRADAERHSRLLGKLWDTADLVLLDDLFSIRGHRRADEARILDTLVRPEVGDTRFRIVAHLLRIDEKPEEVVVGRLFDRAGVTPTAQDLQVVWRCLVLGHRDEGIRAFSALKLSSRSMWEVVSHPSIPVASIYAIGERMAKHEGEDAKKIFFDCIRSRVEQAVETFHTEEELSLITKLIMQMLGFSFLVETGYFERFDDLLRRFLARAHSTGMKVDYFERLRETLETSRAQVGEKGPSKPPAGIKSLPLTIQRRLAAESRYIYWFVTHPDPRIACETLRHIGLMHVERVLRLREINGVVLTTILRKPELFTRQQAVLSALNHPKCSQEFANKYVPNMVRSRQGRQALEKIAQNPSASPVVRSTAKRSLQSMARRTQR